LEIAIAQYASDNQAWGPVWNPQDQADWTTSDVAQFCAGRGIWNYRDRNFDGTVSMPAYNQATGLGLLAYNKGAATGLSQFNYVSIDDLFCPAQKVAANTAWNRREHFAKPYQAPFPMNPPDAESNGSGNWSPYLGGSNFYMNCHYAFRGSDWGKVSFEPGFLPNGVIRRQANKLKNVSQDTPGYNQRPNLADSRGTFHAPMEGGNVGRGDGSGYFFKGTNSWRDWTRGGANVPADIDAGFPFHSVFMTHLFWRLDQGLEIPDAQ
jgi:hypothetical protein